MYEDAIEILKNHVKTYEENVNEWEREADPHRTNQVRAESLRKRIEQIQLGIGQLRVAGFLSENSRALIQDIANMTDPDNPESYRCDDREGCFDTIHDLCVKKLATWMKQEPVTNPKEKHE